MTLLNFADILSEILGIEVTCGCIDGNLKCTVGVYNPKSERSQRICLGGYDCTKTLYKDIVILIHWTDVPARADEYAQKVSEILSSVKNYGNVKFIRHSEPIWAGRDERGICEYIINATIIYERS